MWQTNRTGFIECHITYDDIVDICEDTDKNCGYKNNVTTILLNNKRCKEIQAHGQCSGSWKYLTKFSGNSAYQCAEAVDETCRFYRNKNSTASCDIRIEDETYYNIVCRSPSYHKQRIACCSLLLTAHPKHKAKLQIPFDWGPGCGNLTDYKLLTENYIKISSLAEPTTSECSLKISLFENEDFAEFYLIAEDLRPINRNQSIGKFQRWRSEEFRIYYPNCVNPKTDMKNEGELI